MRNNAIYGPLNIMQLHIYQICWYLVMRHHNAHARPWPAPPVLAENDHLRIQKEDQKYKIYKLQQ